MELPQKVSFWHIIKYLLSCTQSIEIAKFIYSKMTSDEINIAAPNMVEANIEVKELAEFMGLSEKNISARLTRIREKMKQYLIEREVFV